jgi:anhydro-N-acetylmuramic acid kinase
LIAETETISYDSIWVERLKKAITFNEEQLILLNKDYTQLLGDIIKSFIERHAIENLDDVCSHGHTVLHRPQDGVTLQIGNLSEIAAITKQKVVCDFRVQDVELGGQGAPLVPIGDRLLFPEYTYCLNLGGFSNISFEKNGTRIAFDICPVNTVLNYYANKLGLDYDSGGAIAASGIINEELLMELNNLEFYRQDYPKSLGFEFVRETVLPLMEKYNISSQDKLAAFTEHIAIQISLIVKRL